MLFENEYGAFLADHDTLGNIDASIGVKQVADPSNYEIVEVKEDRIAGLEEKPAEPASNLAISGFYIVEDTVLLLTAIEHLLKNDLRGAGDEYQLTDALQRMPDQGGRSWNLRCRRLV